MKENDLALISAAVYAYLNSEITEEQIPPSPFVKGGVKGDFLGSRSLQRRNKWKWSFAPAIDKKGHRIYQWSR
jgi:hypothetical protein